MVTGLHPERRLARGRRHARRRPLVALLRGAGVYGQLAVSGTAGPVLAAGSMLVGGLILLPLALFQLPDARPELGGDRVDRWR